MLMSNQKVYDELMGSTIADVDITTVDYDITEVTLHLGDGNSIKLVAQYDYDCARPNINFYTQGD